MLRFLYENNLKICLNLTGFFCACEQPAESFGCVLVSALDILLHSGFEKPSAVQQRSIIPIVKGVMKLPHRLQTES